MSLLVLRRQRERQKSKRLGNVHTILDRICVGMNTILDRVCHAKNGDFCAISVTGSEAVCVSLNFNSRRVRSQFDGMNELGLSR